MEEGSDRLPSAGELPQNACYTRAIFCSHLKLPHLKLFRAATRRKQPHLLKNFNQAVADSFLISCKRRSGGWEYVEPGLENPSPATAHVMFVGLNHRC